MTTDDAPMLHGHAWTSSSSNSSNNGFIGSNVNNKRQVNSSSYSSSTASSSIVREDRAKQTFTLPETFVDEGVSFVRFATSKNKSLYPAGNGIAVSNGNNNNNHNSNLNRSASSVTSRPKSKAPIAKPVRRSKSQLVHQQQRNYVTSIQHGGAVTLVSLNSDSSSSTSSSSDRFVTQLVHHHHHHHYIEEDLDNEWHRGRTEVPAFQVGLFD